jgi:hypothetical protein
LERSAIGQERTYIASNRPPRRSFALSYKFRGHIGASCASLLMSKSTKWPIELHRVNKRAHWQTRAVQRRGKRSVGISISGRTTGRLRDLFLHAIQDAAPALGARDGVDPEYRLHRSTFLRLIRSQFARQLSLHSRPLLRSEHATPLPRHRATKLRRFTSVPKLTGGERQ